jgi:pyrimidine operon attenuation protein / uracil phosphoribosyltransferase
MPDKKYILTKEVAAKKLRRLALEIIENNAEEKELILAGIRGSGTVVASCIQQNISALSSLKTKLLTLTLDKRNPTDVELSEEIDFNNKTAVLIDDVANSGKTILYALKPFLSFHPRSIQVLVLVERTHTSFPVTADYVGLSVASTSQEHIYVEVSDAEVLGAYLQ